MKKIPKWRSIPPAIRKTLLFMKFSLILFFTFSLQLSASVLLGQDVSINTEEASLRNVLDDLKEQTGTYFMFNEDDMTASIKVDLAVDNGTLKGVLDEICDQTPFKYEIIEDFVVFTKKAPVLKKKSLQKKKEVKGIVTDKAGMPLPGVTVLVKGTYIGTTTDINGNYRIEVPADVSLLTFSFIGMQAQEFELSGSVQNVIMIEESIGMEEVTITAAYGSVKRSAFTGSASVVNAEVLRESPDASMLKALQGKAAGVVVTTGGQPGAMPTVRIRGIGSLGGNQSPLYIIDGVPVLVGDFSGIQESSSVLSMLNPEDIESQTILKDAAATSLYGSRGANGVIIITTKSGKAGKTKVNFSAEYGLSDFANPHVLDIMNTKELAEYAFEARKNQWLHYYKMLPGQENFESADIASAEAYAWSKLQSTTGLHHPDDKFDGTFDYDNMTEDQAKEIVSRGKTTNWKDAIFRVGKTQKYDLSISGGNEKNKFYSSLGYFEQEGVVNGSAYERFSGALTLDSKINNFLSLRISEKLSHSIQEGADDGYGNYTPMGAYAQITPSSPVYLPDGSINMTPGYISKVSNPVHKQKYNSKVSKITRALTNLSVNVKFTDWLRFETTNSIDLITTNAKEIKDPRSKEGSADGGWVGKYAYFTTSTVTSNLLKFNKQFGLHNLSALAGFEHNDYHYESSGGEGHKFASEKLLYLGNAAVPQSVYERKIQIALTSYLSKLDYNYDNKYYASGSFRRDGSSKLSADSRWGNFYSASLGWVLSKEDFMDSADWLNFAKLRASYGTSGNLPIDAYGTLGLFSVSGTYNDTPVLALNQLENSNLEWEKSYTLDFGLDYRIFDKVSGSIDFFHKHTKGLINGTPLLHATGRSSVTENKGALINKGLELEISSENIKTKNFSWSTDFNITYLVSKVDKLSEPELDRPYMTEEGKDVNSFYMREWAGVDSETGRPSWYLNTLKEDGTRDRTIVYDPTDVEMVFLGKKGYPDFRGGFTNRFTYKGFDLSFLCTYSLGATLIDYEGHSYSDGNNIGKINLRKNVLGKHWQKPGDNAEYSRLIFNAVEKGNYGSSRLLMNGDYLKIKNVSMGYNLPKSWISKMNLEKVRLYFNASDLYTFFKHDHIDPEVGQDGYAAQGYDLPTLKTYRFGINVNF